MIKVYDGLVSPDYIEHINSFVQNSYFKIGNQDGDMLDTATHRYIYSEYSEHDLKLSGFIDAIQGTEVGDLYNRSKWVRTVTNLSTPSDSNFLHTHFGCKVILYYVNNLWETNWGGETVFYNAAKTEVIKAVNVVPGRIVVFDGNILHSIRPQQPIAPHYRFSMGISIKE